MTDTHRRLLWLAVLVAILLIVSAVAWRQQAPKVPVISTLSTTTLRTVDAAPQKPPEYTPEITKRLEASKGFDFVVSYTDNGFGPKDAVIKKGQTVRFTNNSKGAMKIVAPAQTNELAYPGKSECGGSSFGTCADIAPRDFWEFTFTEKGAWTYKDENNPLMSGSVQVK